MHSTLHISSGYDLNIKYKWGYPILTLECCTITTIWIPEFKISGTVQNVCLLRLVGICKWGLS